LPTNQLHTFDLIPGQCGEADGREKDNGHQEGEDLHWWPPLTARGNHDPTDQLGGYPKEIGGVNTMSDDKQKQIQEAEVVDSGSLEALTVGADMVPEVADQESRLTIRALEQQHQVAMKVLDTRLEILDKVRELAFQRTLPEDWVIQKAKKSGDMTSMMCNSGAMKIAPLYGIQIKNLRGPDGAPTSEALIEETDGKRTAVLIGDAFCAFTNASVEGLRAAANESEDFIGRTSQTGAHSSVTLSDLKSTTYTRLLTKAVRVLCALSKVPAHELAANGMDMKGVTLGHGWSRYERDAHHDGEDIFSPHWQAENQAEIQGAKPRKQQPTKQAQETQQSQSPPPPAGDRPFGGRILSNAQKRKVWGACGGYADKVGRKYYEVADEALKAIGYAGIESMGDDRTGTPCVVTHDGLQALLEKLEQWEKEASA
jgi:hypothetical protein